MVQNVNQFAITPIVGDLDLQFDGSVVSGRTSINQATPLVAGQPVSIENTGGDGIPNVIAAVAGGPIWGFVVRNLKDQSFPAGQALEVARSESVMWMTASAAIARGAAVEFDTVNMLVKPYAGVNPQVGEAYGQAVNANDVIRVWLHLPSASNVRTVKTADVVVTLAQINAGQVIIPGVAGQQIRVTNFVEKVTGTFATGTSVALQSDATSVAVETTLEAALTNGATLVPGSANVTLGAGFANSLPAGEGLKVVNNGAAQTGGTSIEYIITYQQY